MMKEAGAAAMRTPDPDGRVIRQRAICLNVSRRSIGIIRKATTRQVKKDGGGSELRAALSESGAVLTLADPERVKAHKKILAGAELDAIRSLDAKIGAYLRARCLDSPLRKGIYLVPLSLYDDIERRLNEFKARRKVLVGAFIEVWDDCVKQARVELKNLFNETDYPSRERVIESFDFDWMPMVFDTPAELKQVRRGLFEAAKAKVERRWKQAEEKITLALVEGTKKTIDYMVERLTDDGDGNPKVFKARFVEKATTFFDLLKHRNIVGLKELDDLVEQAKEVLTGVTPDDLRDDKDLREAILESFTDMQPTIDEMATQAHRRAFEFPTEAA